MEILGEGKFRREEDQRWLEIQKELLSLVAALRTEQQVSANREVEVQRLIDHVEDLDEHLRGVGGKESLDTRLNIYKHTLDGHTNLLANLAKRIASLEKTIADELTKAQKDIWALQYEKSLESQKEGTRTERLKEWLGFWGTIIGGSLALIVPLVTVTYEHWDSITHMFVRYPTSTNTEKWMQHIQEMKKDPKVKKMLTDKYGDKVD